MKSFVLAVGLIASIAVVTNCVPVPDVVDEKVGEYGWLKIFEKDGCTVWRDSRSNPITALVAICKGNNSVSVSRR